MVFKQLICCVCLLVIYVTTLPYENQYGSKYGDEWLLYYDEEGNTHTMNFSTLPNSTRTLIYGDAYYYLYTRRNTEPEELHVPKNNETLTSQYFEPTNKLKVITHGWLSSTNSKWIQSIKNEFLRKDDYNVILIDWHELSANPVYPWSAFSTRYIGKKTAKLLDTIAETYEVEGKDIHLIGHSLGSHVMAYTSLFSNLAVHRITGLDPARPLFELPMMSKDCRLEKSDAQFVDIIHSCGNVYGYNASHGHADFYPNSGKPRQPGCTGLQQVIEGCSHGRAVLFFNESINSPNLFHAYPCESWDKFQSGECKDNYSYMGYQAAADMSGNYYLHTNSEPPFARGDEWNRD